MDKSTDTEQKIIAAATHIFLEKGKDGARMQQIADYAGINKALLHYYFRSKEKLFLTVFNQELQTMLTSILNSLVEKKEFKAFLFNFIPTYLREITRRKNLLRFILWESGKTDIDLGEKFFSVFKKYGFQENPILVRVKEAIKNGEIKNIDARHFVVNLLSMCIFPLIAMPLIEKVLPGTDSDNAAFMDNRIEQISNLVWNGVRPDSNRDSFSVTEKLS